MRRALWALLVAGCTLDPLGVLNRASLTVRLFELPLGGQVQLTTVDATGAVRVKKTPVLTDPMDLLYEEGALAPGLVLVSAELTAASGALTGCGTARGVVGEDAVVVVGFASPSTSALNCGACGNRCETGVATGQCVNGACAQWECAPGLIAEADGGCSEPVQPPDAGGVGGGSGGGIGGGAGGGAAGGSGGGAAGGSGGGQTCTGTSAEDTEATCSDGLDNNCDARTDCADPGCQGVSRGCTVAGCAAPGVQQWSCATRTWGACVASPQAENTIATCSDGQDNDCDGKGDCADDGCTGIKVGCGVDICAAGLKLWQCSTQSFGLCLPYIPLPENSGLVCGNGLDDDCDGNADCLDGSCRGRGCGLGKICCADGGCSTSCQ